MTEVSIEVVTGPNSTVIEALKGRVSEPKEVISHKPESQGKKVKVRLVEDGAGMVGLKDREDNREWAGIFNHYVKTAGASLQLGKLLKLNGQEVDLQLLLNTVMLSHSGRRQYDEATWYPSKVDDAARKREMGDMQIGLSNLRGKSLSPKLIDMISVHGLGTIFPFEATKTWNEKLPMYLDFRIAQNAMPMEQRFVDLQRGVASGRYTQEFLGSLHRWAALVEKELFEILAITSYDSLKSNPRNLKTRIDVAIKLGKFSEEEAKLLRNTKLYKQSGQDVDPAEISGMDQNEFLSRLELRPEDINDLLLQPERWERYIRRLYINDAEEGIFARLSEVYGKINSGEITQDELDKEFPKNTWWGKYSRELFDKRHGEPLHPRKHKKMGIARAIEFCSSLEEKRKKKDA